MSKFVQTRSPDKAPVLLVPADLKPLHQLQQIISFPPPPSLAPPLLSRTSSSHRTTNTDEGIGSRRERTFILFSELRRIPVDRKQLQEGSTSPPKGSQLDQQLEREKDPLEWVVSVGRTSAGFDGIAPLVRGSTALEEKEIWWERAFALLEVDTIISDGVGSPKEKLSRLAESIKLGTMNIRNYVEGRYAREIIVRVDITETWKMLVTLPAISTTSFSLMEMLAVVVPNQHQRIILAKSLTASQQETSSLRKELDKLRQEKDELLEKNAELRLRKGGEKRKALPTLGDEGFIPGVTHKPLQTFGTSALSLARSIPGISPPSIGRSQSVAGRGGADPTSPTKGANGNGNSMDAVDEWGFSILSDDD